MKTRTPHFKHFLKSRLGNKVLLLFILIASIPLLILGNISLFLVDSSHKVDVASLQTQLIREHEERISAFIGETLDVMDFRVNVTDIESQSGSGSWQDFLARGLMEDPLFQKVSFVSTEGTLEVYRSRTDDQPVGAVNMLELPAFQTAKDGNTFIGEVYQSVLGPRVTMAAPIVTGGRVVQVIIAEINLEDILIQIRNASLGNNGYLVLLDAEGVFVTGGASVSAIPGENFAEFERIIRLRSGEILNGLDDRDRYKGYFSEGDVAGAGKIIPDTKWILMTEWPLKDADAVAAKIRGQILFVTIISIIAVLILAYIFANRLVRPIRLLQKRALEIEKGEFENKVNIKTHDELEDLGLSFNKMAKGLKRLDELRNEFVYISTHELRAPVTAIKGYISMIREGSAGRMSEKLKEFIDPVWISNERLVRLVDDLLKVARSEAGKLSTDVKEGDLRDAVSAIVAEAQSLGKEKDVSVTYDRPKTLPQALFDEMRIKEVIMNLISNAVKYNNKGGYVKLLHEVKGKFLVTHVEDNGLGISPEDQKHMFEKFFRAETKEAKDITGTGLGMFITKEIVKKGGGEIWFTSELGKGSRFSFSVPLAKGRTKRVQKKTGLA